MIGHENPGVYGYLVSFSSFTKPMSVGGKVFMGGEASLSVIAALGDVLWNTWRSDAELSSHFDLP